MSEEEEEAEEEDEEEEAAFLAVRLDLMLSRRLANSTPSSRSSEIRNEEAGDLEE